MGAEASPAREGRETTHKITPDQLAPRRDGEHWQMLIPGPWPSRAEKMYWKLWKNLNAILLHYESTTKGNNSCVEEKHSEKN
ncbi:hypothetical protein NDU88_002218 [Pleurodeles waltl]|uniref:Uncharacterized protein n=1 Tax=Pleurodeles waltl TaxID=8319 RepID=A0AAV7W2D1_PLEWA|nr:hypothetical protein NDU88_002218 [Pleurodeles waltl]